MLNDLNHIIKELIDLGYEGDYWDYKQKWHRNKEELMRDILAFTNTSHNKDCYLIIGVGDNGDIMGVVEDDSRRKQADILDMIDKTNFAGDNKPKISVNTIIIEDKEIDILTIFDCLETPIYIRKRNGKQKQLIEGYIYVREGDRNTPMTETANINSVEKLWKKRFAMETDVFELYKKALRDKWNWRRNDSGWYYAYNPDFYIIETEDDYRLRSPFYAYIMCNESTSYYKMRLMSKITKIYSCQEVVLDSGRYSCIMPHQKIISQGNMDRKYYEYRYFVRDSLDFLLYDFLYREEEHKEDYYAKCDLEEILIIFNNDSEAEAFEQYANTNLSELINKTKKQIEKINNEGSDIEYTDANKKIIIAKYFKKMFLDFRKNSGGEINGK